MAISKQRCIVNQQTGPITFTLTQNTQTKMYRKPTDRSNYLTPKQRCTVNQQTGPITFTLTQNTQTKMYRKPTDRSNYLQLLRTPHFNKE